MPNKKLKVIFMGTPEFACPALFELISDPEIVIPAVVTAEDKPVGRTQTLTAPPVKVLAVKNDLTVLQPSNPSDPEFVRLLKELKPDFIVVVAYGKILKKELLDVPKYGCVNLHGSLLPKYRGASPVEEALLRGDTETGISFIRMSEKLDAGDVLLLQRIKIEPVDDSPSLRKKLSFLGARLLPYLLKDIRDGQIHPISQDESLASHCRKITKEDGLIDPKTMTAEEIVNRIRAYTPWPQCHLTVDGKRLKILSATAEDSKDSPAPGRFKIIGDELLIGTKKGALKPAVVQMEGKKSLPIQDFLRGNSKLFK